MEPNMESKNGPNIEQNIEPNIVPYNEPNIEPNIELNIERNIQNLHTAAVCVAMRSFLAWWSW